MAKILLVEDDNNLREIYEARLQAEGYDIVAARDGEEALVVAKSAHPDLVISDVMMPKISGFEMLDIMRNTPELQHVKVIMLTALGQSDDQNRASSLGADRYLVKSQVTLEDIVNVSHQLLVDAGVLPGEEPAAAPAPAAPAPEPTAAPSAPVVAMPVAEPVSMPVVAPPQDDVVVSDDTVQPAVEADAAPADTVPESAQLPSELVAEPVFTPAPTAPSETPEPSVTTEQPIEAPQPVHEAVVAQPAPDSEPQSVAEEQDAVRQQIESFVAQQDGQAPSQVEPAPQASYVEPEMTTPVTPAPSDPTPAATTPMPEPVALETPVAVEPAPVDVQQDQLETAAEQLSGERTAAAEPAVAPVDDGMPKKKVIQPLNLDEPNKKSLDELLAEEAAKQIMDDTPQLTPQPSPPTTPTPVPQTPPATPTPQPGVPPRNPNDFDPNSIAL